MEQFVLLHDSVYKNKKLNFQSVTKQGFSKDQVEQNPTYQTDALKEEQNKKLFAKEDSSDDKIFSCPRIKFSKSQPLIMDGVQTLISLSDFAQKLRGKNTDAKDIYFTWPESAGLSPTLVLNHRSGLSLVAKAKERGKWVFSKYERQKQQS